MACGTTTCESGCYKDQNDEEDGRFQAEKRESMNGVMPSSASICLKCKANRSIGASTAHNDNLGDCGKFCADCFRSNLYGKFKLAVTSNAMISPTDTVLVAFSGGSSSRVALEFVHEMQYKAQKNFDASRDRSLPVFGVGVAFIDESAIYPVPCEEFDKAIDEMRMILSNLTPPCKEFHVVPIQTIFSSDSSDGKNRLKDFLGDVSDVTGREDLLLHLRMLSLQKVAIDNGYSRILLGSCTSKIACHVIAATIKGQGYSLAADIQYVDARWDIPVVLPLRDCLSQELNLLCSLESLKTVEVFNGPCAGINGLVSSFVKLLQEENPSRECTIVRTAGKLTPFQFNKMPESADSNVRFAAQRRIKRFNLKPTEESLLPNSFCPICSSPLNKFNIPSSKNGRTSSENFADSCCASCRFQILPKEQLPMEHFLSLLPHPVIGRSKDSGSNCLREQIQDFLLSDNEDGT